MNNSNPILLGVNIDHVATLRQSRGTIYPEPIQAALVAEQAGADLAVRSESDSIAMTAKGLRDWGNDSHLTRHPRDMPSF